MARPGQDDPEFGVLSQLGIDLDRAAVLFHDNVMAHRKTESGAFAGRLGRIEWVEHLVLHLGGDAGAVVANAYLYRLTEVFCSRADKGLKARIAALHLALGHRIKSVRDQIQ